MLSFVATFISGGLFAIGSDYMPPNRKEYFLQLGKDLTHTCHEAYDRTGNINVFEIFT